MAANRYRLVIGNKTWSSWSLRPFVALMAVGAYTCAILIHRYHVDYLVTIPIAGLLTGVVGFLLGIPALRLSALYLALATFALAVVTPSLIKRPAAFTGGVQGILLSPPEPPQFARDAFASVTGGLVMTGDQWMYYVSLIFALVLFWLAWNLVRHRPGRAMRAIRAIRRTSSSIRILTLTTVLRIATRTFISILANTPAWLLVRSASSIASMAFPLARSRRSPHAARC